MECDLDKGTSSSAEKNPADVSARPSALPIILTKEALSAGARILSDRFDYARDDWETQELVRTILEVSLSEIGLVCA